MSESTGTGSGAAPRAERPRMGGDYGISTDPEGMLPWSWAEGRLVSSRNYWICTAGPAGRPHAMPVWGVWVDGALYFSTGRRTRKARNLAANPTLVVHLESGDEVVILEGRAEEVVDRASLGAPNAAYAAKYINPETGKGFEIVSEEGPTAGSPVFRLQPALVYGWRERDFPTSATRWRF